MKNFFCPNCSTQVFFTNTSCLSCNTQIAFDLSREDFVAVESPDGTLSPLARCQNGRDYDCCNWAVPAGTPDCLCASCQLTELIPDLTVAKHRTAWAKIEAVKRRLVYNLNALGLPLSPKTEANPNGVAFRFLADSADASKPPVLTGHASGVITLNIAEADDAERERRRASLGEPYRTLLGHLRHEIGHYFWEQLVAPNALDAFRSQFGDERSDYQQALQRHYQEGPRPDWADYHISSYASVHPWEDWAETWAHYLHLRDSLSTAIGSGVSIQKADGDRSVIHYAALDQNSFEAIISAWPPLACLINSFNRSLGTADAYPFVTNAIVAEKLRFIHDLIIARQPKSRR